MITQNESYRHQIEVLRLENAELKRVNSMPAADVIGELQKR